MHHISVKWLGMRSLKKYLPAIFYGLVIVFLVVYLKSIDFSKFRNAHFVWSYLFLASVLGLAARYWAIFVWFVILKNLGAKNLDKAKRQLIYVFAKSWMGRYIPGTAPWILGKIYFASKHGISKNKLAVSSLLEGGLQIAVTMATAFVVLLFDSRLDVIGINLKVVMIVALVGLAVAVSPPVFNRIISIIHKLVRKKNIGKEHLASKETIAKAAASFVISAILSGVSIFFIVKAIDPTLNYSDMLFVFGAANLSGALGMLAIFVPSGIGVRDGIFLALLSVIMPTELALLATVASRLWNVVLDVLFFGISKLIEIGDKDTEPAT